MKTYTLIGGVNGVGKSSLTGVLLSKDTELGIVIDADKISKQVYGDNIKSGKIAIQKIEDCLNKGINFTQETTLSGNRTLKTIKKAIDLNYHIRLYYVGVNSCEESIIRIENRVRKGGHNIPTDDVRRRYQNRINDLLKILPYCNEIFFYDNENGFREIAKYINGNIYYLTEDIPAWLLAIKNLL